jgi:transcriptional regulator with XRE-family HTH domain
MQEMGITQQSLAHALGSTRAAVGHYLSGRRNPNLRQIQIISETLKVTPAWLLYGYGVAAIHEGQADYTGAQPEELILPVTGTSRDGHRKADDVQPKLSMRLGRCYALAIIDADYSPRIYEGEFVLVNPDLEPAPGDEVVIKTKDTMGLYSVINMRGHKITIRSLHKRDERKVVHRSDIQYMHCIVAVFRDKVCSP